MWQPPKKWSKELNVLLQECEKYNQWEGWALVQLGFWKGPSCCLDSPWMTVTYPTLASSINKQLNLDLKEPNLGPKSHLVASHTYWGCRGGEGARRSLTQVSYSWRALNLDFCYGQIKLCLQLQRYTKRNDKYLHLGSFIRLYCL